MQLGFVSCATIGAPWHLANSVETLSLQEVTFSYSSLVLLSHTLPWSPPQFERNDLFITSFVRLELIGRGLLEEEYVVMILNGENVFPVVSKTFCFTFKKSAFHKPY